jgi:hypothetical protein
MLAVSFAEAMVPAAANGSVAKKVRRRMAISIQT